MAFSFTKNLVTLSLALGLAGGALVAIPAAPATAAPSTTAGVVQQEDSAASLKGGRIYVQAGTTVARRLPTVDANNNPLTYHFQGRPLDWVTLENNLVVFEAPATQEPGVHRVTVRVTNGKGGRAYVKYIVNILPAEHN
ncbi:hypothetical protein [Stomatohabitans albus]|uniref:hypothetical protein n=1 Tax=Stomatohabitans albus TaxID=3110766 RepID=UPI00300CFD13